MQKINYFHGSGMGDGMGMLHLQGGRVSQAVGLSLGAAVTLSCMGATAFAQDLVCDSAAPVGTEAYL